MSAGLSRPDQECTLADQPIRGTRQLLKGIKHHASDTYHPGNPAQHMARSVVGSRCRIGSANPGRDCGPSCGLERRRWNAYAPKLAPDASFTNLFGMVMYGAPAFAKRHNVDVKCAK